MRATVSTASRLKKENALGASNTARQLLWPAVVIVAVVVLDQVTKIWALNGLVEGQSIEVLGRFLMFTLLFNEGGAMGTVLGSPTYYLISSLVILAFILIYLFIHRDQRGLSLSLAAIAGGAIGNVADRLRLGRVVDFIDVDFININMFGLHLDRFWTFNIADAAISCAIVYLVLHALFGHRHERPAAVTNGAVSTDDTPPIQNTEPPGEHRP